MMDRNQSTSQLLRNFPHLPQALLPPGLDALYTCLLNVYPSQRNPMQISAIKKYWLGGTDPLDYVNVYFNAGDRSQGIPPHWHYVSMGLTDLHGDGRVHPFKGPNQPSGVGFELTFRLKREPTEGPRPPVWPAAMMQHLAKYALHQSKLSVGDFVKWNSPLDGLNESRIHHILLVNDLQLPPISTPCGNVEFLQIVGICEEERKAVQKWNVFGISNLLRKYSTTGGPWLITDLRRGESVFDVDPCAREIVDLGVASEGSNLSGIQAWSWWTVWNDFEFEANNTAGTSNFVGGDVTYPTGEIGNGVNYYNRFAPYAEHICNTSASAPDTIFPLTSVHIRLNAEAASFIPSALKGRLAHGRHFTFKSDQHGYGDVTLLPAGVTGSFTTSDTPYAYRGTWLHVQVCLELQELLLRDFSFLEFVSDSTAAIQEPRSFQWPEYRLKITVLPDVPAF